MLHGGALTTQDMEIGLKVIPSIDWKFELNNGTVLDYEWYMEHKTDKLECYGKVVGQNSRCKIKKGQFRVKWNNACKSLHAEFKGTRCHYVGYKGEMMLGMRPQLIGYTLTCNREFGARYSMLDFCLDQIYAMGVKDNPQMVKTCYRIASAVKTRNVPRKSAGQVCSPYAECEDWELCPRELKVMFKIVSMKGCQRRRLAENELGEMQSVQVDEDGGLFYVEGKKEGQDVFGGMGQAENVGDGVGDDGDEEFLKELYGRYVSMKRRMDNPGLLHEGDILEGKFIMNSLHHIIDKKGVGLSKEMRRRMQMAETLTPVVNEEEEVVVDEEKEKNENSEEKKSRQDKEKDRKDEKSEKDAELKRKNKKRRRRRRRLMESMESRDAIDDLMKLQWDLHEKNEIFDEMKSRLDDVEYGINFYEYQISYWEDRLQEWDEEQTEHSWMTTMDIVYENEEKIWKLKEIRDDLYHHLWILEEKKSGHSKRLIVKLIKNRRRRRGG